MTSKHAIFRKAEVCYLGITITINKYIFSFDVTMDYTLIM